MPKFEVTAFGFSAGSDATDDRAYWVEADSEEQIRAAIVDTGATFWSLVPSYFEPDFKLPEEEQAFRTVLLHWFGL